MTAVIALSLDQAAAVCSLSKRELQNAIRDGELVAHYRGRKPLIRPEDLEQFVTDLPTERKAS